ncbi:DeoR/GlpR family DNA-binding transcription regulator [Cellulomonas sp.]|uniref:DeoR/GlpR family DNA-binding transcription regulator n=1 Tax=Cellulomonas sp. TaxID=40001 RepID=UPI003BA96091
MLKDEDVPLPATVRRERMQRLIDDREYVRVADLAEAFGISDVTVRTDLDALHRARVVRRVRGGAMSWGRPRTEQSFEEALTDSAGEKQAIGAAAAAMVRPGMSVLLDVGTTTTAIARAVAARTELEGVVVITNGLNIALELEPAIPRLTVLVTGGTLRRLQHSLVDPLAAVLLDQIHADLAFIGCNGIDLEHGVTNINLPEAVVKRRMVASAESAVVVADGSKLGQAHLGLIVPVTEVDTVITGRTADAGVVSGLRRVGVDVIEVGGEAADP